MHNDTPTYTVVWAIDLNYIHRQLYFLRKKTILSTVTINSHIDSLVCMQWDAYSSIYAMGCLRKKDMIWIRDNPVCV